MRKTKTSTKSKILGNGDLVEETTVTEVTETITHRTNKEDDSDECADDIDTSYNTCMEACKQKSNEKTRSLQLNSDIDTSDIGTDASLQNLAKSTELKDEEEEEEIIQMSYQKEILNEEWPPNIKLPTGISCCLSQIVNQGHKSWTFYLSGLIRDVPIYCDDR